MRLTPEDLERPGETIAVLADAALLNQVSKAEADIEHGREDNAEELAARCSPIPIASASSSCPPSR
jgi:hypothetical protein